MEPLTFKRFKLNSPLIKGFFLSLILTLIFLNNYIFNLNKPISFAHADTFHGMFIMRHYFRIFQTGDFQNILNPPMFYGFKNSLLFSENFVVQSLFGLPTFLVTNNIVLSFNIMVVSAIFLSFFSMFYFTYYLTKQFWLAILASIIFVFNPFIFSIFPDQPTYFFLMWIPLIFLYLEKSLSEPKRSNLFFFFVFLTVQVLSSLLFLGLLSVVLPIYILIRLWQLKINPLKLFNSGAVLGLLLFCLVTGSLGFIYTKFNSTVISDQRVLSQEISTYSAWVSDLLFAPSSNSIYGGLRDTAHQAFPDFVVSDRTNAERNLFLGIVPVLLLLIGLFSFKKIARQYPISIPALVIFVLTIIFSFGFTIHLTNQIRLPGIYGIFYTLDPLLNFLRIVSRFAIFGFFFLGLFCAFTLDYFMKNLSLNKKTTICLVIISLTLLEYFNKPWDFMTIPDEERSFYTQVEAQKDVKVIVELPLGYIFADEYTPTDITVDHTYLFWASTLHSKKLVNGYSSYFPEGYKQTISYLNHNFPNPAKLAELKKWGVDGIILHRSSFLNPNQYQKIDDGLKSLGVNETVSTPNLSLFSLVNYGAGSN